MRKLKQLIRLHIEARLSIRKIALSLSLSVGVVSKYVKRLQSLDIADDILLSMDEDALATALLANKPPVKRGSDIGTVDFAKLHKEMKRKGVTMQLLWEEYAKDNPLAISYSRICYHYRQWKAIQPRSMRQTHKAGDKVFIDYIGQTIEVIDPETGEVRQAQIFIGVLGASNFSYVEATWSQQLPDFIGAQTRMFEYFGCVPALVVPDNLKSAVHKSCLYEPDINPAYSEFIAHYNTAVMPTRPYRPKDKAKVESGVQLVQRWILARLRHSTFVGLGEVNAEIKALLEQLNNKPFQKQPGSRQELFETVDKPAMKSLPEQRYEYKHYKKPESTLIIMLS